MSGAVKPVLALPTADSEAEERRLDDLTVERMPEAWRALAIMAEASLWGLVHGWRDRERELEGARLEIGAEMRRVEALRVRAGRNSGWWCQATAMAIALDAAALARHGSCRAAMDGALAKLRSFR